RAGLAVGRRPVGDMWTRYQRERERPAVNSTPCPGAIARQIAVHEVCRCQRRTGLAHDGQVLDRARECWIEGQQRQRCNRYGILGSKGRSPTAWNSHCYQARNRGDQKLVSHDIPLILVFWWKSSLQITRGRFPPDRVVRGC